jgi:hypothetical protein
MAIPVGVVAGSQTLSKGSVGGLRGGYTGEGVQSKYLADYAQIGLDGNSYSAANQAAQAISVALATTYTGIGLYNPAGSNVVLLPKFCKFALSVAPAAISTIGLISASVPATTNITLTTRLTVQGTQIGATRTAQGIAFSAATIPTPVWLQQLMDGFTAAALPSVTGPIDLRGQFQLLPGSMIAVGALTAVTGLGSITWDEVPFGS